MRHTTHHRRGFTLLELMVCVALALVLIYGINVVFSLTGRTISTGQAWSDLHRDVRAASSVIAQDATSAAASDGPFFMIRSAYINNKFRNADDQRDNIRQNFRSDRVAFFARGIFKRVTGDTNFVDDMTAPEAYIWYGHLRQPGPSDSVANYYQNFKTPGEGTAANNPNNFFASKWILGRSAILLREKNPNGKIDGHDSGFYERPNAAPKSDLSPLAVGAEAKSKFAKAITNPYKLQWSRFDLAATSIDGYRTIMNNFIGNPGPTDKSPNWWNNVGDFYFEGDIQPRKPLNSESLAALSTVFLQGCTDFAVEYAGDFVTQNPTGGVTDLKGDGVIDFEYDAATTSRKTRWFGMTPTSGTLSVTHPTVKPLGQFIGNPSAVIFETSNAANYYAAWDSHTDETWSRPKMLRMTMVLDDATARISGGQIFEFVLQLQ